MFQINLIDDATVASSGLSAGDIQSIKDSIQIAADVWGRHIDAPDAVIDIRLSIFDIPGDPLATAGASYFSSGGPWESRVTQEFAANTDDDPGTRDAQINIDLSRWNTPNYYFVDDSFEADPAGLPANQFDFLSVLVHEFGHILGLSRADTFTTPFDALVSQIGGVSFFTGANAVAANGGQNIELDSSHYADSDLMDPFTNQGERGYVTPVHIGIWEDIGVPMVEPSSGSDVLWGYEELDDTISASGGNDRVYGLTGDDTLNGGGGTDRLYGGRGADELNGGGGLDWVYYEDSSAGVTVNLSTGAASGGDAAGDTFSNIERIFGSAFDDVLTGSSSGNFISGGDGDDEINGLGGGDILRGDDGADDIDGGGGADIAYYNTSDAAVTINLTTGVHSGGHADGDTLTSIERILGSRFDDTITGDGSDNILRGEDGDDELNGGGGIDTLSGDEGADDLNGGSGNDWARYNQSDAAIDVDLNQATQTGGHAEGDTFTSIERVYGSRFDDDISGDSGGNLLRGHIGDDTLVGRSGNDFLRGDAGGDVLNGGGDRDWALYNGSDAAITVNLDTGAASGGHADGDTFISIENVLGSRFGDTITGDSESNFLRGNTGADTIEGGTNDDNLEGGTGGDTFVFNDGDGDDTVLDFEDGTDTLRVEAANFAALTITNNGGNARVDYGGGVVELTGISSGQLTNADFEYF